MAHDASQVPYAKNGNDRGHIWERRDDGDVDDLAYDVTGHNGPRCSRCGFVYCVYCDDGPDEDCHGRDPFEKNDREQVRFLVGRIVEELGGAVTWADGQKTPGMERREVGEDG